MKKLTTAKRNLLDLLKKHHEMTIEDMMVYFTISEVAVRKHLRELENNNYIKRRSVKQTIGRPYHLYGLTESGHKLFPNKTEQLPLELLHDLEDLQGREAVSALLRQRMKREQKYIKNHTDEKVFHDKVKKVAEIQNENGCMVEVTEKENGDFEIVHYNCPIAAIAKSYNEICNNEGTMYNEVFSDCHVSAESKITNGDPTCKWVIKKQG